MTINFNFNKASKLLDEVLKRCIPAFQLDNLKNGILLNPRLSVAPQQWFVDSFEWFFALDLLPGERYGPFYRVDGDEFWPQIGNPDDTFSENKCFYGFRKPSNVKEAKEWFGPKADNAMKYVYQFSITATREDFFYNALMFIGPVRNGAGFQANPNGITAKIIQLEIMNQGVVRYVKLENGDYFQESKPYIVNLTKVIG